MQKCLRKISTSLLKKKDDVCAEQPVAKSVSILSFHGKKYIYNVQGQLNEHINAVFSENLSFSETDFLN